MGKNKKNEKAGNAYTDLVKAQKKDADRKARKAAKRKKVIVRSALAVAGVALIVGGIFGVRAFLDYRKSAKQSELVSFTTAHFEISNAEMAYFYMTMEDSFLASGDATLKQYGVDPKVSLREQQYNGKSWFDVLMESVKKNVNQMLVLLEAAQEKGITLTDEENAEVDKEADALDVSHYGKAAKRADLRQALAHSKLALKYSKQMQADAETDEDDWNTYYDANSKDYLFWKQASYTFSYAANADGVAAMTEAEAKTYADSLAQATTEQAFSDWMKDYLTKGGKTEDEATAAINSSIAESGAAGVDEAEIDWFLTAPVNTSHIVKGTDSYKVYLLLSKPARKETNTIDVRHILVKTDTHDSDEAAKAEAERIYALWQENPTEDNFAALAEQYTEDPSSKSTGGLYDAVAPGEMVQSFNDWCFDASRKTGDTGIVQTSYGYHVMYFAAKGLPQWQSDVKNDMENAAYQTAYDALCEAHPVTVDDDALKQVAPER